MDRKDRLMDSQYSNNPALQTISDARRHIDLQREALEMQDRYLMLAEIQIKRDIDDNGQKNQPH